MHPLCRACFGQNRPHQLHWGDREMGKAISSTEGGWPHTYMYVSGLSRYSMIGIQLVQIRLNCTVLRISIDPTYFHLCRKVCHFRVCLASTSWFQLSTILSATHGEFPSHDDTL